MDLHLLFIQITDRLAVLGAYVLDRLPELLIAAVAAGVTLVVAGRLRNMLDGLTRRAGGPASLGRLLGRAVEIGVLILGGILVLNLLGLSDIVIGFVSSLGIMALILGFALQDISRQFASGVLLLTLRPFQIGDMINVKQFQGAVVDMRLLTTVLRSDDGQEVLIPNADVYTSPIINYSRYGLQRSSVKLKLPQAGDREGLRAQMIERLQAIPGVEATPAPELLWIEIVEGGVQADLRFWVNCRDGDAEQVRSAAIRELLEVLASGE